MRSTRSRLGVLVLLVPMALVAACGGRPLPALGTDGDVPPPAVDGFVPSQSCASDSDCAMGSYCRFPADCGRNGAGGQCFPVPPGCAKVSACQYVCGCDGKTYCNGCEAARARVSVASEGMCCADIDRAYREALNDAKVCQGGMGAAPKIACPHRVKSSLLCPCGTYVSMVNATMQAMEKRWTFQKCPEALCQCQEPTGAICDRTADGLWGDKYAGGRCVDTF